MKVSDLKRIILLCKEHNIKSIKLDTLELVFGDAPRPEQQIASTPTVSPKMQSLNLLLHSTNATEDEVRELSEKF
jgi:hypothetical protein